MENIDMPPGVGMTIGMAIGFILGIILGAVMDNLTRGIGIGISVGGGLGVIFEVANKQHDKPLTSGQKRLIYRLTIIGIVMFTILLISWLFL